MLAKNLSPFYRILRRRALPSAAGRLQPSIPEEAYSPTGSSSSSTSAAFRFFFSSSVRYDFPRNLPEISRRNFSSEPAGRCWNCNAEPEQAPFLVCGSCRAIQPVDRSIDYFQIFGLERKYDIEDGNLEGKYKDWQRKIHPDLVHSKSEKEREFAAEQSARVIDAYRTLSNPRLRAIYIMKLEGVDVDEEETISDPEMLVEVLEIREAVEEAPDSKALMDIQSLMHEKLQQWYDSFANAFQSRRFEEAVTCIRRMTYYDRVNEEIVKRL